MSKTFPQSKGNAALENISLNVPMGKTVCLLGPNGSGKTTLLKILAGLIKPTSGKIEIMGIDAATRPTLTRAHIGWMPAEERSGFYGRLTGTQNLEFFAALHKLGNQSLDRVLGNYKLQLGLGEEMDTMILRASGGLRQKLGLMRALIHNPSILLLDEPFRNLDPHTVQRFRRLLKDHFNRNQKKTVILSTHLLDEARRIADITLFLKEGRVVRLIESRELNKILEKTSAEDFYLKTIDGDLGPTGKKK